MPLHDRVLHRRLHRLAHRPAEADPARQLLGDALRHQLRVRLGVLHLEDVELHLLAGELLELAADAVGLRALAADDDARPGGVDVDADPVAGALDVDLGDAGALEALGHHPADLDVLADVVLVELVREPAGLPVGRDAEPEPVRVNLLTHYSVPSSAVSSALASPWPRWLRRPSWPAPSSRPSWPAPASPRPRWPPSPRRLAACRRRGLGRLGGRGLLGRTRRRRDRLDRDRDVAGALADPVRPTLRPRPEPLQRRALVDERLADEQRVGVQPLVVLGVGDRAREHLVDLLARRLRRELQHRERLLRGQTADEVDHTARLVRRDAHVTRNRPRARKRRSVALDWHRCNPLILYPWLRRQRRRLFRSSFS